MKKIEAQQRVLQNWREATQELAEAFIKKYYLDEEGYLPDYYWVGDKIGNVFFVNDDFYNIDRMVQALEINATYENLKNYHNYEMDCYENKTDKKFNFVSFVKYEK